MDMIFLLGGLVAVFLVFMRPVLGLAIYFLVYPTVPSSESINPLKMALCALTFILLFAWLIQKTTRREMHFSKPKYTWIYLFFIFLSISPILGIFNNFTPKDWIRDIAPLLTLLLVPVMVDYFKKQKNLWLLYLIFVPIGFGIARDMLIRAGEYGLPVVGLSVLTSLPFASIHPSLGLGLGIIMFTHNAAHKKYWVALAVVSLAVAFLSHTRTVWITTIIMVLLIILFSSKRRSWAIMSLAVMAILVGLMVFYAPGSSGYIEAQGKRFREFENFSSDVSVQNRFDEIRQTAELFESSPIFGVGFGYQYNFYRTFIVGVGAGYIDTNYTHSDIMFIASKGGAVGLILFFIMLLSFMKTLWQKRKSGSGSMESAWATFALIMIINSLIIGLSTPYYQSRWDMFLFSVLLAMGLRYKEPAPL